MNPETTRSFKINPVMMIWLLSLTLVPAVHAGMVWKEALHAATPRSMHAMVTNYGKGNILLFSGEAFGEGWNQDMMEWDGSQLIRVPESGIRPSPRENTQMIYNRNDDAVYLFGGFCLTGVSDSQSLWKYIDENWIEIPMQPGWPIARARHAMAYDPVRNQLLIHGGTFSELEREITWEWDGSSWISHEQIGGPGKLKGHAMCYHEASGQIMMFGGENPSGSLSSTTWVWNGDVWIEAAQGNPPGRAYFCLSYDPVREVVVMAGGASTVTYEWDGSSWSYKPTPAWPSSRDFTGMAYDPASGETILFGGETGWYQWKNDMWSWNGERWREIHLPEFPHLRDGHCMGYDEANREVVLFGGYNNGVYPEDEIWFRDTWVWNGIEWEERFPSTRPAARIEARMVYHSGLDRLFMIGGTTQYEMTMDIWSWDGENWDRRYFEIVPNIRVAFSLSYDTVRNIIVLFGGQKSSHEIYNDTWEFDGTDWEDRTPDEPNPPGRFRGAMAYDEYRRKTVLYGGYEEFDYFTDTWEWDGYQWEEKHPEHHPENSGHFSMFYDLNRKRIILYGGRSENQLPELWEWNGADWQLKMTDLQGINNRFQMVAYDSDRSTAVLFGGYIDPHYDDTWELSEAFEVNLLPNQLWYEPGDPFELTLVLNNAGPEESQIIFVLLEAYGSYWFWPGWLPCPPYLDFDKRIIPPGMSTEIVASFIIPDDPDFLENISFHAALYEPGSHVQTSYCELSMGVYL